MVSDPLNKKSQIDEQDQIRMADRAYIILSKKKLSENVFQIDVVAPYVVRARKAGQFVIVAIEEEGGQRIPLTIAGVDSSRETIRLIFQRVGKATARMADLRVGDCLGYVAGPLGRPTHIERFGTVVCVGGGIGIAPLLPIAMAMKKAGNGLIAILGARAKDLLILQEEFETISDELIVVTDDGSYGCKALVTEPLKEICQKQPKPSLAIAIGPTIMMKFCCDTTRLFEISTQVSLNTIMVDGTGMCGGCRVEVGGQTKFVCVDGPEFNGHQVNFDLMMKRMAAYKDLERWAFEEYEKNINAGSG